MRGDTEGGGGEGEVVRGDSSFPGPHTWEATLPFGATPSPPSPACVSDSDSSPPGIPQPRVHPRHHEADVLPTLPGHVQREAVQQLLPERREGLPGQPGGPEHRVEVPDG